MLPQSSHAEIWNIAPRRKYGDDFTLLSPTRATVEAGAELYLTYGAHCNRTLYVEYGFVNEIVPEASSGDGVQCEVDVQDLAEPLFQDKASVKLILQEEGYWG